MTVDYHDVHRGDVFYADLKQGIGSEQGGVRPVLVVQNEQGNYFSPTTIVVAITSQISKPKLPTHVLLPAYKGGMKKDSIILAEQVRTIDKKRLRDRLAHLPEGDELLTQIDQALAISLAL
ncbi:type II toxin-antitoxin system PemK/MazF family toxin [Leuconostocaceae bacterium ESL0958]|nr:type II toxin-antitoxin system PemK/MazF family toxin [Leuconostocaceae bacterium ESL0958]